MEIKSLDELRQPDVRTQAFTPYGLGIDRILTPESAAEYQQDLVARLDLAAQVAEGTRQTFEQLRTVYAYGILCYEIVTLVHNHAVLVIEQALRDRFLEYYGTGVTFVDKTNASHVLTAARYEQVIRYLKSNKGMKLKLVVGSQVVPFSQGIVFELRAWARAAGLLRGQRNRHIEDALIELRNDIAHRNGHMLLTPVDATNMMSDLAEFINQLWGQTTPSGRLYPAPLRREILTIASIGDGGGSVVARAERLFDYDADLEASEHLLVRAVFDDRDLHLFESRYETTTYPSEWLWGPGSATDARRWLEDNSSEGDDCDFLDRVLVVRVDDSKVYSPMRPDIAAIVPTAERTGVWYVVRADYASDAYVHVRNRVGGEACQGSGACDDCAAESLSEGAYDAVTDLIEASRTGRRRPLPPQVRSPMARHMHWPG